LSRFGTTKGPSRGSFQNAPAPKASSGLPRKVGGLPGARRSDRRQAKVGTVLFGAAGDTRLQRNFGPRGLPISLAKPRVKPGRLWESSGARSRFCAAARAGPVVVYEADGNLRPILRCGTNLSIRMGISIDGLGSHVGSPIANAHQSQSSSIYQGQPIPAHRKSGIGPKWEAPFNHPTRACRRVRRARVFVADGYGNARYPRILRRKENGGRVFGAISAARGPSSL